jgi:hypothetical protein
MAQLLLGACSRQPAPPAPSPAVAGSSTNPAVTVVNPAPSPRGPAPGAPVPDQNFASWASIRDDTFEQKGAFLVGAAALRTKVGSELAELRAKRAAMPSTADTKDWDFAMHEMTDSQQYLDSVIAEAGRATPETWDQEKEKVAQAWDRTQAAYDKVKTSVTQ